MTPEDVREAVDLAREEMLAMHEALLESEAPGGVPALMEQASPEDVIGIVDDLAAWPDPAWTQQYPEMSALAFLRDGAPEVYAGLMRDYQRAVPQRAFGLS